MAGGGESNFAIVVQVNLGVGSINPKTGTLRQKHQHVPPGGRTHKREMMGSEKSEQSPQNGRRWSQTIKGRYQGWANLGFSCM